MAKLDKKEGNTGQCPSCNRDIVCRMTDGSEKYPAKLQWQNVDGTAHYSFDFKTKTTDCKKTDAFSTGLPKEITMPDSKGADKEILERFKNDSYEIAKQRIAQFLGVEKACIESGITNPATKGMIFNAVVRSEA